MLVPSKVKQLAKDLDLDAIGAIHAIECAVNGLMGTWVIDGQHRIAALLDRGLGDWPVDVIIHAGITSDDQACRLFLRLNDRSPVGSYDKYAAALLAGDSVAIGMTHEAEARGIKIARYTASHTIAAVAAARNAYRIDSGLSYGAALDVLLAAWSGRKESLEGALIHGLSLFLLRHGASVDRDSLVKKLAKYQGGPTNLLGAAKGRMKVMTLSTVPAVVAEIIAVYNVGRRTQAITPAG